MEEIEGSGSVDENSMVSKLGRTENPNDKTLEAPTRVYGFTGPVCVSNPLAENNGNKFDIRGSSTDFSSPRNDSPNEIGEFEKTSEENRVKGDENTPQSMISGGHVSENGNFVFDNVCGAPNGGVERNNMVLGENIESGKGSNNDVDEENGGNAYDKVENLIVGVLGKEEEEVTLCEEHKFIVGDLVWVCTKSKSWWPGLIVDPSQICNDASKSDQIDQSAVLLVKYFGNNPTVWCSPMLLKPFAENFKEMSSQGKSRVFLSAVEKAVNEFGRRIKAQMTCSCENGGIKDENFVLDKNGLSLLEPTKFLYLVKNLAWDENKTGVLELVKIRHHLSAFYRSLGHCQLPINQLHETTDDIKHSAKRGKKSKIKDVTADKDLESINKDTYAVQFSEVKSEKGLKSRERRKSKYLSYPYIDATKIVDVSDSLADSPVSSFRAKGTVNKLFTERTHKQTYQPKAPIISELNTPSTDLLSELRFAAVGCVFPIEGFCSVNRFFHSFRRWFFHNIIDTEMEYKKENVEKPEDELKSQEPLGDKSLTINSNPVVTPKRKRRKKNEISTMNPNVNSVLSSGYFDKASPNGPCFLNFESPGSIGPKNLSELKKKKKRVSNIPKLMQTHMGVLPDLNGNYAENGSFVKKVKLMDNGEGINNEATYDRSQNVGNKAKGSSSLEKKGIMGLLAPGNSNDKPEAKKRKRNENITRKMEAQASTISDLNGNANIEVKSPKKRRRRNKIVGPQADLNPDFTKVNMNGEFSGTALVLTFAQGFPVPSKEALIATFCGFGPLNETETKGLTDNRSAQVVFKNGLEAVEALKGIEKSSPFGPVLVKCQLRHIGLKPCNNKYCTPKEAPDMASIK